MIVSAIIKAITFYFLYVAIKNVIKIFQMKQQLGANAQRGQQRSGQSGWTYTGQQQGQNSANNKKSQNSGDAIEAEYRVID